MQAVHTASLIPRLPHKFAMVAVLVIAADILFYERVLGISAALFMVLLAGGIWYAHRLQFGDPAVRSAMALAVAGCLAVAENVSWLSAAFAVAGTVTLATAHRATWHRDSARWLGVLFKFATRSWLRPFKGAGLYRKFVGRHRCSLVRKRQLIAWVLPVGLSLVFAGLFADANPIISDWLAVIGDIDLRSILEPRRMFLWLAASLLCWLVIRPRLPRFGRLPPAAEPHPAPATSSAIDTLFSTGAIVRSLVIFNAMFAVQTILDATYLWGGQALPNGMTYAQYAHRGAYSLVAVALLAAGFVLIAMRPGSESARKRFVRVLVYAWVAQTIILVGASVWRTGLYVSAYSLTYLRVAALIWMALVALGLVWIVLRLVWNRSNAWLIEVNLLTAMGILLVCCFVDVGGAIARYNVEHSREATAKGFRVDVHYLETIGPSAIPALDWYLSEAKADRREPSHYSSIRAIRARLAAKLDARYEDWRGYSFRSYRLARHAGAARANLPDEVPPEGGWTIERP